MSVIHIMSRPVEVFDANNRKHRTLYAEFMSTKTWGKSPVRFIANQPTECDFGTIQRQMIEYYIEKEFGKKVQKVVDTQSI